MAFHSYNSLYTSTDLTMDASTRLYARLAEIPEDPSNLESLDDLIVCAFGAFERYYLCWKTKGGEFRQGEPSQFGEIDVH